MKKKNPLLGRSQTQASQDLFALEVCTNKTYIEIGGNHPQKINNTYSLDLDHGWKGFSVELSKKWESSWTESLRNNICYFNNAITFDYASALAEQGMDKNVGYLSCDIEPPKNTFAALQRVINQGIEFECITFEHDQYNFPSTNFNEQATNFLKRYGYRIAVNNVFFKKPWLPFETWFVKDHISYEEINFSQWRINTSQNDI
jgi:hypothetical protein